MVGGVGMAWALPPLYWQSSVRGGVGWSSRAAPEVSNVDAVLESLTVPHATDGGAAAAVLCDKLGVKGCRDWELEERAAPSPLLLDLTIIDEPNSGLLWP